MLSRDGWGGLAVLAASLLLFWLTLGLKDNPMVPIGPGFYPRVVLGVTAALSLLLIVFDFLDKKKKARKKEQLNYTLVALMFLAFGLYCGALAYLGFRLSTFLYMAAANVMLDPPRGARGWARVVVLSAATAFLTHLVFEKYLSVLLPRGRWTGW
jgi:putative tricarboxylic transport membrane protein